MSVTALRTPLAIGETIKYDAGRVTITLQRTEHTYTVTTYQGTLRIDDNCGAYATEAEARLVARGYAVMYKAEAAAPVVASPLAALAAIGTRRPVRPTMAGAHLADITDPQRLVLERAALAGGTIRRSKNATVAQLKALARKGLVTLNYEANRGARRVVESATLTARGRREAGIEVAAR